VGVFFSRLSRRSLGEGGPDAVAFPADILNAVHEIRDLVRLLAEPAIAERDKKPRAALSKIVGRSVPNAKAVLLMDGSRTQRAICEQIGINQGNLSTLVKRLVAAELLSGDGKKPKLALAIPATFFEHRTAAQ
jgi:hypothetical protein